MDLKKYLPNIPFLKKDSPNKEYFFALNIGSSEVAASVWGVEGKSLEIINLAKILYHSQEQLVDASNRALDQALLDFELEPEKILFGVPDSWLLDDNLKDDKLDLLKDLVKELDVTPLAYVSSTHAIVHLLQKESGVPPTVILVDLSDPLVTIIVKGGKIIGTKNIKRGEDLPQDIEKMLLSFTNIEVLPSKISLYGQFVNEEELEKINQELLSYNWMANLPFLHLPKIEILDPNLAIEAISLAGASEIDPDVSFKKTDLEKLEDKSKQMETKLTSGFVTGDIAEKKEVESSKLGMEEEPEIIGEQLSQVGRDRWPVPLSSLTSLTSNLRLPGQFSISGSRKKIILPLVVVLVLLIYLFLPHAKVKIFVDPKILEKDAQVVADPQISSVDQDKRIIPGKIVEIDESGSDKGSVSGKKQVGDPARGKITIFNKTATSSAFPQGTKIIGPSNLVYSLDSNTSSIPGASQDDGTWGKVTGINITALVIGPDSNLSANTPLSLQGQSSANFSAKVDSGLSGGTTKDVSVVTTDDQKKLLAQVASSLRQKAQSDLQSKLSGEQKILSEALNETIAKSSYSKSVGDQATDFTLNLLAHYKGTAYSDNDLKSMVAKLIQTNVPDGYELNLSETETQADVSKLEKDGRLIFLARFKAKLLPKLDQDKIKSQIAFKTPSQAADILKGVETVIGSEFSFQPPLPLFLQRLPFLSRNISLEVTAK